MTLDIGLRYAFQIQNFYKSLQTIHRMKFTHKITILVLLQIFLIITSFFIIVHFESQINLTGNIVNVAGKNRVLASTVQIQLHHKIIDSSTPSDAVLNALGNLEANIYFLKTGGSLDNIVILPLPSRFDDDWNSIVAQFEQYKADVSVLASMEKITLQDIDTAVQESDSLVVLSNILTEKLGHDVENLSSQLIFLQIALGVINVVAHIFMITFIWRIFNMYAAEQIKAEKFAIIGRFASIIAHDMRNPLGIIRNSVTLIQGGDNTSEAVDKETERINRAIKRMSHQIEGVLNYARTVPLVLEPAPIRDILEQSVESVTVPDNIKLSLPENNITVQCDAEKLEFVFANLILNAVQAINGSPGRIDVRLKDSPDDNVLVLKFENSGPPISQKNILRLFDPLFTTKMQGTGLGLTSCQNIIEKHNGTITCSNHPVTFTICLPRDIK